MVVASQPAHLVQGSFLPKTQMLQKKYFLVKINLVPHVQAEMPEL